MRAGQVFLGVVVGLACTETAFCVRDHGAFPHLNVFVADPVLGVRLRPGATEKVSFDGNPITHVRINADGYRGAEFPAPNDDEMIVVGDSQAFGLGVEEDETFAATLAKKTGRQVIDAGVPTYGPLEYDAVLDELLTARHPAKGGKVTVVYVVNFAKDVSAALRPNVERHAVWDGWAVRIETAPDHVFEFPGRALLYRESHAFFALRSWIHRHDEDPEEVASSEDRWYDLVSEASKEKANAKDEWAASIEAARKEAIAAQEKLEKTAAANYPTAFKGKAGEEYLKTHGVPNDIVVTENKLVYAGEGGPPHTVTVTSIAKGAKVRAEIETILRRKAAAEANDARATAILDAFDDRLALERRLAELQEAPIEALRAQSPLRPALEKARALCDAHGAELVVVALPVDVMVSSDEWKKYGVTPIDVSPARLLVDDLLATSRALGLRAIDATPALVAAEPGAFLYGDLHMTPKGHAAVGGAIANALVAAPNVAEIALPKGRTNLPTKAEWDGATSLSVSGAPKACRVVRVKEWISVACTGANALHLVHGGRGEAEVFLHDGVARAIAPLLAGDEILLDVGFVEGKAKRFVARTPDDGGATAFAFRAHPGGAIAAAESANADAMCACAPAGAACSSILGAPDLDCARTYANDCARILACDAGDRASAPRCLQGWANAGAAGHCFPICDDAHACSIGACTSWGNARVCMGAGT